MLPTVLDMSVCPALGVVTINKVYTRLCRSIHGGADLQKAIELSKMKESKLYTDAQNILKIVRTRRDTKI